jgi:hypothetical protein
MSRSGQRATSLTRRGGKWRTQRRVGGEVRRGCWPGERLSGGVETAPEIDKVVEEAPIRCSSKAGDPGWRQRRRPRASDRGRRALPRTPHRSCVRRHSRVNLWPGIPLISHENLDMCEGVFRRRRLGAAMAAARVAPPGPVLAHGLEDYSEQLCQQHE